MNDDEPTQKSFESARDGATPDASPHPPPRIPDHELIRIIGRGSYGEVWLARNVMGGLRAVKVIYRRTFEHQRPYEREFEGIKRYEPVSRTHESQVAVLHVGRHERDEYYYCVMELADAAEPGSSNQGSVVSNQSAERNLRPLSTDDWKLFTSSYTPHTLVSDLKQRGKLPLDECIALGLSLATALEHLHAHGLIHRDIKPSNVVFINGVPKLADIGLVAEKDSTMSFVGTRGFFPPEGPGTAQADIYSLGKVLYEISTGKDRNEFPDLPSELEDLTEEGRLLEFNEILLRACHGDVRQRYASAREMFHDLSLLKEGKSIRRKRRRERLFATAQKAAVLVALVSVVGAGGFLLKRERTAVRLAQVSDIHPQEPAFWRIYAFPRAFDFSPDGARIVFANSELPSQDLRVWEEGTSNTRRLGLKNPDGWRFSYPRWSPDGRRIMVVGFRWGGDRNMFPRDRYAFLLIDPASGELRQVGPEFREPDQPFRYCWRPDGAAVTYATKAKARQIYTLELEGAGRALWVDWQPQGLGRFELGDYSPDGRWLALSSEADDAEAGNETQRDIWIVPHLGGRAERLTDGPGVDAYPTWGPDGKSIYYVSSGVPGGYAWNLMRLHLDPKTGRPIDQPQPITSDLSKRYLWPKLVAGGTRLAYAVEVPNTQVWMAPDGQPELKVRVAQGRSPQLSPDGQTVYYVGERDEQRGLWAVDRSGQGSRQIKDHTPRTRPFEYFNLSPDGRWIAYSAYDGQEMAIFVLSTEGGTPKRLQTLEGKDRSVLPVWSPDSEWLAYADDKNLYALRRDGGERKELAHLWRWQEWTLLWSPTGRHVAAFGYESPEEFHGGGVSAFWASFPEGEFGRLTPASEDKYKEGLSWYDASKLTYMYYGPGDYDAQIRWAYLDGRTELLLDQEDHWDWIGVWAPDRLRFHFASFIGEYDLRLMSIEDVSAIPGEGRHSVIVARLGDEGMLHFKLFDFAGKKVFDRSETELSNKSKEIEALKAKLDLWWDEVELTSARKNDLLNSLTSITGHPLGRDEKSDHHVFHLDTGQIDHGLDMGMPQWSGDGSTMIWTEEHPRRHFAVMEGFE